MEHTFAIGTFPPGKRDYLFRNSVYSGKFPVERTKKSCAFISQPGFPEFFGKWKTLTITTFFFAPYMAMVVGKESYSSPEYPDKLGHL